MVCERELQKLKNKGGDAQARASLTCSAKPGLNCRLAGVGLDAHWPLEVFGLQRPSLRSLSACLFVLPLSGLNQADFNSSSFSFDSAGRFLIPLDSRFHGRMTFE